MKKIKMLLTAVTATIVTFGSIVTAYAGNYAENAVKYGLQESYWVVLGVTAVVAIGAWIRRSTVAIIVSLIVGGLIAYGCKNPEIISRVGETIGQAIFGG